VTRIFTSLAVLSLALLCAATLLGLRTGDYNGQFSEYRRIGQPLVQRRAALRDQRPRPVEEIKRIDEQLATEHAKLQPLEQQAIIHMMFGVAAALVAVLVNSICITYFVGTGRWIREVVEAYRFPQQLVQESTVTKRRAFPWAMGGMLTAVGIIALGAAAHPGTIREGTAAWVTPHLIGALAGTAFIALAYFMQAGRIAENYALIQRITDRVHDVRVEKGLEDADANAEFHATTRPMQV
jgi:hypothetical protein